VPLSLPLFLSLFLVGAATYGTTMVNTSSGTNMTVTIPVGAATDGATMINTSSGTNMTVTIPVGAATDGATMVNTSNGTTMTVTIPACAATDGTPMVFPQDVWEHDIDTPNIDTQPTANTIHAQSASSAFLIIFRRGLMTSKMKRRNILDLD
jgi:hypothetical protein